MNKTVASVAFKRSDKLFFITTPETTQRLLEFQEDRKVIISKQIFPHVQ